MREQVAFGLGDQEPAVGMVGFVVGDLRYLVDLGDLLFTIFAHFILFKYTYYSN